MKQFRKIIFWSHLIAGVFAGSVVLVMSVTGVLLTYEKQLTAWADKRSYGISAPNEATRLPLETLIGNARTAKAGAPTSVILRREKDAALEVVFGREGSVFINPYDAQVLGEGAQGVRGFFHFVTDWHRWLGASGDARSYGRGITGACNLAFLFIVTSGFYLWFPSRKTWNAVKSVALFRRGLSGRARDFNWHNVIGIWSVVPLFIIVLAGVPISYTWASNLVYRIVGENPPPPRPAAAQPRNDQSNQQQAGQSPFDYYDDLLARAERHTTDWRTVNFQLPASSTAPATFTLDAGSGGQPQRRATLTLNRTSGEVEKFETYNQLSPGRRLRSWLRFAHTGEVFGIVGQTVAGIVSLGAIVLVWTGLSLSWRRFRVWRAKSLAPKTAD